jgi:hypothetical protein
MFQRRAQKRNNRARSPFHCIGLERRLSMQNPSLRPVELADLRPTQISLGMPEVQERRDHHHLVRAMIDEGVKTIMVSVTADLGEDGRRSLLNCAAPEPSASSNGRISCAIE